MTTTTTPASQNPLVVATLRASQPVMVALKECSPELREEALKQFGHLESGELDEYETEATLALLAEILFPNADSGGLPGRDLAECEADAPKLDPAHADTLDDLNRDEVAFTACVKELMAERGMTQSQLAAKVGIGQPAVSMLLNRESRPQRKTVARFAEALGVEPGELFPSMRN